MAGAIVAAVVLAAYPVRDGEYLWQAAAGIGGIGVLFLAVSVWRGWPSGVAWTLALLAGEYALALTLGDGDEQVDAAAPFYAGGLLLLAELAYWSIELRAPGREDAGLIVRRLAALGALVLTSVALGTFVVAATAVSLSAGLLLDVIGAAAAVATLAFLARLARRP